MHCYIFLNGTRSATEVLSRSIVGPLRTHCSLMTREIHYWLLLS